MKKRVVLLLTSLLLVLMMSQFVSANDSDGEEPVIVHYDQFFFINGLYNDILEVEGNYYYSEDIGNYIHNLYEITDSGLVNIPMPGGSDAKSRRSYNEYSGRLGFYQYSDKSRYRLSSDNVFIEIDPDTEQTGSDGETRVLPYQYNFENGSGYYIVSETFEAEKIGDVSYLILSNGLIFKSDNLIYWELVNDEEVHSRHRLTRKEGYTYYITTKKAYDKPVIQRTKDYVSFEDFDGLPDEIKIGSDVGIFTNPNTSGQFERSIRKVGFYEFNDKYYFSFLHGDSGKFNFLYVFESDDLIHWSMPDGFEDPTFVYDKYIAIFDRAPFQLATGEFWMIAEYGWVFTSPDLLTWTSNQDIKDAMLAGVNYNKSDGFGGFENHYSYENGLHVFSGGNGYVTSRDLITFEGKLGYSEDEMIKTSLFVDLDNGYDNIYIGTNKYGNKSTLAQSFSSNDYNCTVNRFFNISLVSPTSIQIFHKGEQLNLEEKAYAVSGRTLMPVRALSEHFGYDVDWEGSEKKITITKGSEEVIIYLDNTTAYVNGEEVVIDVPPTVKNSRTFVPVRFICESIGLDVDWQANERAVILN